ncbi:capping protein inhibiting regulator of actin dynamics-like [Benincasa hispida]|uniref:capping protein inhibiting regulator of actin dynamics-like n=1 Tax=Benincasa hispida TaxID=102211 RepID=UPI001901048C|nr:capping protein inhibiting regulator of actin dynamics-like [Benincasa hispida]
MEKEGELPKTGIVNQPLPSEEEMEEALRRSAPAISDPKEIVQIESYEGPIRVALEEVVAEKHPEMAEEKKKKKMKKKRAKGDEEARPRKEKNERKTSERRECRREEERLKTKEEKRKRVESPKVDGESTTARVDEGVLAQHRESTKPEQQSTQIITVATDDGEDSDNTHLMRRRKENASQGSTVDP